jgi:hypothetical protein
VINSVAAIEPAIEALPVTIKLMTNVSNDPVIRQLTDLANDRPCASRPLNNILSLQSSNWGTARLNLGTLGWELGQDRPL